MENVREHRVLDITQDVDKLEWAAKQPTYRMHNNIRENLVSIERWKDTVVLDKPIYIGASVLELSKLLMLDFHYGYIKEMYPGRKSVLGFSDTDSLLYKIETEDIYRDMRDNHEHFDLSNYSVNHRIFERDINPCSGAPLVELIEELRDTNKKRVGKFKDEAGGELILEFVGLRSKAYSFRQETWDDEKDEWYIAEHKKCKGVKRGVVKRKMLFNHYKDVLYTHKSHYESMVSFRSRNHHVQTIEQVKKALSCYDDKRFILADGIASRAHGHTDNIFDFI